MTAKQLFKRLAKILLYLEIGYVVAATVFLNVGVLSRLINTDTEKLKIDYRWAFSPLPGLAFVRGVGFRVQDPNVQLYGHIKDTFLVVSIPHLFHREFVALSVIGDELKFYLRLRRKADVIAQIKLDALPPIPGIPSVLKPAHRKPSKPGDDQGQWRLQLSHVNIAKLSELWFDRYHFVGDASVKGGFYLKPSHAVEIFPCTLTVKDGALKGDDTQSLTGIAAEIHARIEHTNTTDGEEEPIGPKLSGSVALHAHVQGIEAMNVYLQDVKWVKLSGGVGDATVDVKIKKGQLQPDSNLELFLKKISADLWRQRARGDGYIRWRLVGKEAPKGELELALDHFSLGPMEDDGEALVRGKGLAVVIESQNPQLDDPLKKPRVHVQIPDAEIQSLKYLNGFLPANPGIKFLEGRGTLNASFYIGGKTGDTGAIQVNAPSWKASLDGHNLQGKLLVDVKMNGGSVEKEAVRLQEAKLDLSSVILEGVEKGWWGKVRISDANFAWDPEPSLQGKFDLKAKNAKFLAALYLTSKGKTMSNLLNHFLEFSDLRLAADIDLGARGFRVSYLQADAKNSRLEGWLAKRGTTSRAMALVEVGPLAAALDFGAGDTRVIINDAVHWFHSHSPQADARFSE